MKRIEFRLSMPNIGSRDGKWSGSGKNYTITRNITDKRAKILFGDKQTNSWHHTWHYNFGDGWVAQVTGRIVPKGERLKKSDGFCGYDWMVTNIVCEGKI